MVKNLELFQQFLAGFKIFTLKTEKGWKCFKFFTYVFSEKSVKNNGHFSPFFFAEKLEMFNQCMKRAGKVQNMVNLGVWYLLHHLSPAIPVQGWKSYVVWRRQLNG
jgi:hypothetical protein